MNGKKIRILCLDGGGVRGVVETAVLARLEKEAGKPVSELFDYFAGTSVGGLVALYCGGLGGSGQAAEDLFNQERLGKMMHQSFLDRVVPSVLNPEPKYDGKGKRDVLREVFGSTRLTQAVKPVLVTAYDFVNRRIAVFKSQGGENAQANPLMSEIADASSAAPSFYPSVKIDGSVPKWLCDGGVAANDPSMCALAEAIKAGYKPEEIELISIGTGFVQPTPQEAEDLGKAAEHWGTVSWLKHGLVDHLIDGSSSAVGYWCKQILGPNYLRVNGPLVGACPEMDDTDPKNLDALKKMGESWWQEFGPQILAKLLPDQAVKPKITQVAEATSMAMA